MGIQRAAVGGRGWAVAALLAALAGWPALAQAPADAPDFEQVFSEQGEPGQVHFVAEYRNGSGLHRLELWRDGSTRVRRRTDQRLDTWVSRPAGEAEWHVVMLDHQRKIRTDIDRSNLYRIGQFADWFGLTHGLSRPKGSYRLSPADPVGQPRPKPLAACQWWRLERADQVSQVCWSSALKLPLQIRNGQGELLWRVKAVDLKPQGERPFQIDDQGYLRNDANADISAD